MAYADPRPKDLQVPSGIKRRSRKGWKRVVLEDTAYIVLDRQRFTTTTQFYVTRHAAKRYGGTLINDGDSSFQVFFESSAGYYSEPVTLEPGAYLAFQNYPVSGITLKGSGTYTLVAWAARSPQGYVRRIPAVTTNVVVTIPSLVKVDIEDVLGNPVSALNPLFTDPIDRAARKLGIVYGNLGQLDQILLAGRNLATFDLEAISGAAISAANPLFTDPIDRAARLLGVTYGNLGKIDQRLVAGRNIVTQELDAVQAAAVTGTTGIARLQPWYQPNFVPQNKNFASAAVAPAGVTVRATYTVPANRRGIITAANIMLMRDGAPGVAGLAQIWIDVNSGARVPYVVDKTAAIGLCQHAAIGKNTTLIAGDVVNVTTFDNSTGGTYLFAGGFTIDEFDT